MTHAGEGKLCVAPDCQNLVGEHGGNYCDALHDDDRAKTEAQP